MHEVLHTSKCCQEPQGWRTPWRGTWSALYKLREHKIIWIHKERNALFLTKMNHEEDLKILVRMVCEMLWEEANPGLADGQVKASAANLADLSSNPWG